ncbi:cobyrinate a,c-diamide synthase [Paracoccus sp. (in: a-proteobacteria)]|uniref:cobyrinate a,c-diamide synthase n=1 Tax=Paracoccus sp. TaxID=267 RepID=UPI002AFF173F|nr:cobyrinate a,c-diamide synthase [Paracoccus sp. (in: a-proteobacteria)]
MTTPSDTPHHLAHTAATALPPGLLIAAPRSGSGKSTVTLGLQRALVRAGLKVQAVKCGPDYIDTAFHAAATSRPSINLDSFAMPPEMMGALVKGAAAGADLIIAEGSMGLFDGVRAEAGRTGASADVAAVFGWPVVLVVDVAGAAQSAAAVALGCAQYDPRITVAGVILNNVASDRHQRLVEEGLKIIGLPVLGVVRRDASLLLPERHLGLVQANETENLEVRLERLADTCAAGLDLAALQGLAATKPEDELTGLLAASSPAHILAPLRAPGQRIALAQDRAFSFIYAHVLEGWRQQGAEVFPFSPLANEAPPEACDSCWLPGGYPELHSGQLAAATVFLDGLRRFAETRPVHGECGGYMVLGRTITDADGIAHPMAGLLPVATSYAKRKLHLGYRIARLAQDCILGPAETRLVGHEFHYASITDMETDPAYAFADVSDAEGRDLGPAGHKVGRVSGSFFHAICAG